MVKRLIEGLTTAILRRTGLKRPNPKGIAPENEDGPIETIEIRGHSNGDLTYYLQQLNRSVNEFHHLTKGNVPDQEMLDSLTAQVDVALGHNAYGAVQRAKKLRFGPDSISMASDASLDHKLYALIACQAIAHEFNPNSVHIIKYYRGNVEALPVLHSINSQMEGMVYVLGEQVKEEYKSRKGEFEAQIWKIIYNSLTTFLGTNLDREGGQGFSTVISRRLSEAWPKPIDKGGERPIIYHELRAELTRIINTYGQISSALSPNGRAYGKDPTKNLSGCSKALGRINRTLDQETGSYESHLVKKYSGLADGPQTEARQAIEAAVNNLREIQAALLTYKDYCSFCTGTKK